MPTIEINRAKIVRRLEQEGWALARAGAEHDLFKRPDRPGTIVVPRHRALSIGVARQIAKAAGWI